MTQKEHWYSWYSSHIQTAKSLSAPARNWINHALGLGGAAKNLHGDFKPVTIWKRNMEPENTALEKEHRIPSQPISWTFSTGRRWRSKGCDANNKMWNTNFWRIVMWDTNFWRIVLWKVIFCTHSRQFVFPFAIGNSDTFCDRAIDLHFAFVSIQQWFTPSRFPPTINDSYVGTTFNASDQQLGQLRVFLALYQHLMQRNSYEWMSSQLSMLRLRQGDRLQILRPMYCQNISDFHSWNANSHSPICMHLCLPQVCGGLLLKMATPHDWTHLYADSRWSKHAPPKTGLC